MECLRIPGSVVPCNYSFPNSAKSNFSNSRVYFAPSWRRRRRGRNGCLRLRGSVLGESDDRANRSSQIDQKKGSLVLGTEKDDSGSIIGFHLIPPSGDVEVAEPPEDVISDEVDEAEGIDGKEEPQTRTTYNIVFVTAEAAPYSKTGGLGDVCGSLPIVLASRGHRVMVVSPRYLNGTAADKKFASVVDTESRIKVPCFGGEQEVAFFHEYREGVDWVFVDHPAYHRPGNPYGDCYGAFGDNQECLLFKL